MPFDCAAIEIELEIRRHVVGGRVDGPGRAHDDVRVRKRSRAVGVIKRGRRTGSRLEVCRGLHPNGIEKILLHKVFEPLARYFLDDVGRDRRTCVAIGHARTGMPPRCARVMVVVEALAHTHGIGGLLRVFAKVQVVPARGVLEQVHHPDGIARFPWIVEPHLRREFVNGIVERQLALVDQHQDRQRYEGLRGRTDAEERIGGGGTITRQVGHAEAGDPFGPVFVNDRDRRPIRVGVFEDLLYLLAEFVDRSGRVRLFVLTSESIRGGTAPSKQEQKNDANDPLHVNEPTCAGRVARL